MVGKERGAGKSLNDNKTMEVHLRRELCVSLPKLCMLHFVCICQCGSVRLCKCPAKARVDAAPPCRVIGGWFCLLMDCWSLLSCSWLRGSSISHLSRCKWTFKLIFLLTFYTFYLCSLALLMCSSINIHPVSCFRSLLHLKHHKIITLLKLFPLK